MFYIHFLNKVKYKINTVEPRKSEPGNTKTSGNRNTV